MINHISIAAENPEKVAGVLTELWDGAMAIPFPPCPGGYIVIANDGRGSGVEIVPHKTVLVPGEGLPPEENFDLATPTEEHEAKFVQSDFAPPFVATHLNINTNLSEAEVKEIARREGWRVLTANRDKGFFQLIEIWVENRFMLEVMTPEQTKRYVEITDPVFLAQAFGSQIPPTETVTEQLNLIG